MASPSPGRAGRTWGRGAAAVLALALIGGVTTAASPVGAGAFIAAAPATHKPPIWALTPVGFSHVRNYQGFPVDRVKEILGGHYKLTVVYGPSVWPRAVVDTQTPHDVNLVYGAGIELRVSDGTPPPPAPVATTPPVTDPPPVVTETPAKPAGPDETSAQPAPEQTPPAQTPAAAAPPPPAAVPVSYIPDFTGGDATRAEVSLTNLGFPVVEWSWIVSRSPRGLLLAQSPMNVNAPRGTAVRLWVSAGPAKGDWMLPLMVAGAVVVILAGGGWLVKRTLDRRRLRARRAAVRVAVDLPTPSAAPTLEGRPEDRHALEIRAERGPGPPHLQPKGSP